MNVQLLVIHLQLVERCRVVYVCNPLRRRTSHGISWASIPIPGQRQRRIGPIAIGVTSERIALDREGEGLGQAGQASRELNTFQ